MELRLAKPMNIESSLIYRGSGPLPLEGNLGDVRCYSGATYIWTGDKWEDVGEYKAKGGHEDTTNKKLRPKLCLRCGAPLHGGKCGYCDTEYY